MRLLEKTPKALDYLKGRGLTLKTIARFGLGIAQPYPHRAPPDEQTTSAIMSPVIDQHGRFLARSPKTTVPSLTTNPRDAKGWSTGSPMTSGGPCCAKRLKARPPLFPWGSGSGPGDGNSEGGVAVKDCDATWSSAVWRSKSRAASF